MLSDDSEIRFAALSGIEQLGSSARPLWGRAAALSLGKNDEYSRRIVVQIRDRLAADRPAP